MYIWDSVGLRWWRPAPRNLGKQRYTIGDEPFIWMLELMKLECYEPRRVVPQIRDRIMEALDAALVKSSMRTFEEKLLEELRKWDSGFKNEVALFQKGKKHWKHCFDIYNPRLKIAIEVEKTEVKRILHDLLKFSIGNRKHLVDLGVLIVPKKYRHLTRPFRYAIREYEWIKNLYWGRLLIIGYEK